MSKTQLCLIMLICLSVSVNAQQRKSCCLEPSATAAFASMADQSGFVAAHEAPLPFSYAAKGIMISFPTPDGKTGSAYLVKSATKSDKYLFVFHEWWGLNDYMKRQADMYADSVKNINVIALDLYEGKLTTNAEDAGKIMQTIEDKRARSIITGALTYVGKDAKIGTIGWCLGGGWSMQAALMGEKKTKACVMYYGMPETDVNKLKNLNSSVLFIFAKQDQWINEGVKNDFVKNMNAAGKKLTVKEYDADHAFANPSNPDHKQAYAAEAQHLVIRYLNENLK